VVYRIDDLPAADLSDLEVQAVGPGETPDAEQREFLRSHYSAVMLWYLLRWNRRGRGWLFLARSGGKLCHYTWVKPARGAWAVRSLTRGEPDAILVGPCMTQAEARGRSIYPRVLRQAVHTLRAQGHGPFYIYAATTNAPSLRGIEKAGFRRLGVYTGRRALFNLLVRGRLVEDGAGQGDDRGDP
jgi:RimJ/RimL family protein N-acetyltransferase